MHCHSFDLYRALAYIAYCAANEPKHCSPATRKKLVAARHTAKRLCEEALLDDLQRFMEHALALKVEQKTTHYEDCEPDALWRSYRQFVNKVGGQHIDFRSYVEAATRASLRARWNENKGDVLLPTNGNDSQRVAYLFQYAERLGLAVDSANDEEGNAALVFIDIKAKAKSGKKVIR